MGSLPVRLLSAKEVGSILGLGMHAVYRLWDSGELPSCRIGAGRLARRRCSESDVEGFLRRMYRREGERRKGKEDGARRGGEPFNEN